ncbi:MAG: hypothetical protein L3V56_09815 [Candidatus Magnetoovum sp. WYHC-5]|nr:hypothetical protein [Candidatus Magnetoovum sp. WYHC-5]
MKKKLVILLISQIIIFYAAYVNQFPEGYFFTGGDCVQYFNFERVFAAFKYTWFDLTDGNGLALQYFSYNIYYYFFDFLSKLFFPSYSEQGFLYFYLFFMSSFWSFFISVSFFAKGVETIDRVIFSFLYTFNLYTLSLFCYTWGYTPFALSYVTFPIIMGCTYRFFLDTERVNVKVLWILSIACFLQNIPNGNLPFFISLNLFVFCFIVLIFLFNYRSLKISTFVKHLFLFYTVFILCMLWSVLPQIPEMIYLIKDFKASSSYFDLKAWVLWLSVPFSDLFFLTQNIANFADKVSSLVYFSIVFFLVPFLIFLIRKTSKTAIIFCLLLIFNIFLTNKGKGILDKDTIWFIFNNPVLSSIRNYEKTLIFFPFILLMFTFTNLGSDIKKYRWTLLVMLFCTFISVYPFFSGGILEKHAFVLDDVKKNYKTSEYSYLVKMPTEYLELAQNMNLQRGDFKLLSAPYSVINSFSWVNYPKWKVVSLDPTLQLFNNPIVQMNAPLAFGNWVYGELWNKQEKTQSLWLLELASLMNVNYIIYHKDVRVDFYKKTKAKMYYYESIKQINKLQENDYFILYEINNVLPRIYSAKTVLISDKDKELLPQILLIDTPQQSAVFFEEHNNNKTPYVKNITGKVKKSILYYNDNEQSDTYNYTSLYEYNIASPPIIEYKRINPAKYRVKLHFVKGAFPLVFSDTYRTAWELSYITTKQQKISHDNIQLLKNGYKLLNGNAKNQATLDEVLMYIDKGLLSTIGDGDEITKIQKKWLNQKQVSVNKETYYYDFISKELSGTIQNNNMVNGNLFETLFCGSVFNNSCLKINSKNHLKANGFSNAWLIEPDDICKGDSTFCIKNADGSYDMELILEYSPQKLYYITFIISIATVLVALGFYVKSKRMRGITS